MMLQRRLRSSQRGNALSTVALSTVALSTVALSMLLIGGWTLHAAARQSPSGHANPPAKTGGTPAKTGGTPAKTDAPAKPADSGKPPYLEGKDVFWNEKTGICTLREFLYHQGDMTVTGLQGRYDKVNHLLDAKGDLVLDDPTHHVTGDQAHVDHGKAKLAILTGNMVIVLKPEQPEAGKEPAAPDKAPAVGLPPGQERSDTDKERGRGVTITCDRVEDYYRKKFIIMRGNLKFKQQFIDAKGHAIERTLTAEHAEYDGKTEKMVLFAPVEGHDSDGQQFHPTANVTVGTKRGEETLQSLGSVKFIFQLPEDDSEDQTTDQTTVPAQPSGAPPARKP